MQTVSSSADEDPVKTKLRSGWAESSMAYRCPYERDTHRETPLCKNEAGDQGDSGDRPGGASSQTQKEAALISDSGPSDFGRGRFCCSGHLACDPLSGPPGTHSPGGSNVLAYWKQKTAGFLLTHECSHPWGSFLEVTGFWSTLGTALDSKRGQVFLG